MENYILWPNDGFWKVFDPDTFAEVARFENIEDAFAYIKGISK